MTRANRICAAAICRAGSFGRRAMYGEKAAAMVQRLEQAGNTEVENKASIIQ